MNIDNWYLFACAAAAINGCIIGIITRFSLFPTRRFGQVEVSRRRRRAQQHPQQAWLGMTLVFGVIAAVLVTPAWHDHHLDLGRMMASCFALAVLATAQPEWLVRIGEAVTRGLARIE